MRLIKRIIATVLAFMMLMSATAFAATIAEGTNGNTINISFEITSDEEATEPITSVEKDEWFYIWIKFSGNPTELADSIQSYDLLVSYDPAKMSPDCSYSGLGTPLFENFAFLDGVAYFSWANIKGLVKSKRIQESGTLFGFDALALTDLTKEDLDAITLIPTATAGGKKQDTLMNNGATETFTIAIPDPLPEKPTITGSAGDKGVAVKVTSSENLNAYDTLGSGLTVFVGVYNSDDELVDAKFGEYLRNGNDFLVDVTDASYYKAFVWDANRTPVVDAIQFNKEV